MDDINTLIETRNSSIRVISLHLFRPHSKSVDAAEKCLSDTCRRVNHWIESETPEWSLLIRLNLFDPVRHPDGKRTTIIAGYEAF